MTKWRKCGIIFSVIRRAGSFDFCFWVCGNAISLIRSAKTIRCLGSKNGTNGSDFFIFLLSFFFSFSLYLVQRRALRSWFTCSARPFLRTFFAKIKPTPQGRHFLSANSCSLGESVINKDDLATASVVCACKKHSLRIDIAYSVGFEVRHNNYLLTYHLLGSVILLY